MRFELSVALKYLIPRLRQFSVAIISLVSVLVVSMVVWLVIVFLSVTEGLEKKWVSELVSLNAPVRLSPTDEYYNSYYYQIDSLSAESNYGTKTIGQKLISSTSDPFDPTFDAELPEFFPKPDTNNEGNVRDLVKESFQVIDALKQKYPELTPSEYEVAFGTLNINLYRDHENAKGLQNPPKQSRLAQVSYVAAFDSANTNLANLILKPNVQGYSHLLQALSNYKDSETNDDNSLKRFFDNLEIKELTTPSEGYLLPPTLHPRNGKLKGFALFFGDKITKVIVPQKSSELAPLFDTLLLHNLQPVEGSVIFDNGALSFLPKGEVHPIVQNFPILLDRGVPFEANLIADSLNFAKETADVQFILKSLLQGVAIEGTTRLGSLEISHAVPKEPGSSGRSSPLWLCSDSQMGGFGTIPTCALGSGVLLAKQFQKSGVEIGDTGYISYTSPSLSGAQEHKLPVYVAGFYDPGLFPMASKLIFVGQEAIAQLRSTLPITDTMLGNGINVWIEEIQKANLIKEEIEQLLTQYDLKQYWNVQSYHDYEFAKPILQQLKSDKNLFTLIAIIILVVACSNIISMLILLVNDKRKEIGILQALGLSSFRIATIFGFCGLFIGIVASIIGITLSVLTLHHLQKFVDLLSFFQGHDAFHTAFYGAKLPSEVSMHALSFVLIATTLISLIAAMIPAIKASRIRPSQILRSE